MPFVFAALTMLSVGRAAESIMWECRHQMNEKYFHNTPLDPAKCVKISTISSLKEMVIPGVTAVFVPIIVGTFMGTSGVLGLLAGKTQCFLVCVCVHVCLEWSFFPLVVHPHSL